MRRAVTLATTAVFAAALSADAGEVTDWLMAKDGAPRELREIASFTPDGPAMLGADPLTYDTGYPFDFTPVPQTPAQVIALLEPREGRVALAGLIFQDGTPACGDTVGAIWVDSGTAAFLTRSTAAKLAKMADDYDSRGLNLYDDYFAAPDQMGDSVFARLLSLPDGTQFPGFSSGWGDGAYPVVTLFDDKGKLLALYADFIGPEAADDYIYPPSCTQPGEPGT